MSESTNYDNSGPKAKAAEAAMIFAKAFDRLVTVIEKLVKEGMKK